MTTSVENFPPQADLCDNWQAHSKTACLLRVTVQRNALQATLVDAEPETRRSIKESEYEVS